MHARVHNTHAYTHTYIIYIHAYMHTHDTYMHTYMHTYIHIYKRTCVLSVCVYLCDREHENSSTYSRKLSFYANLLQVIPLICSHSHFLM